MGAYHRRLDTTQLFQPSALAASSSSLLSTATAAVGSWPSRRDGAATSLDDTPHVPWPTEELCVVW